MKVLGIAAFAFCCGNCYAGVIVTEFASPAPNSFNSPSFAAWGANAITALQNGLSSVGDPAASPAAYYRVTEATDRSNIVSYTPGGPNFYSWMGLADPGTVFGSAFANETGNRLQFGVTATGTDGMKVSFDQLSFVTHSSDPANGFQNSGSFLGGNYSQYRVGLIFNGANPPTVITSGPGSQLVDEILYVGVGGAVAPDAVCTGTDQEQLDCASAFYDTFMPFSLTTDYTLSDNTGVIGSSSATVNFVTAEPGTLVLAMMGLFGVIKGMRRSEQSDN